MASGYMKKHVYLISLLAMVLVFTVLFVFAYVKVSGSEYEELLKREASGLPDSRHITLAIRVKPNQSRDALRTTLQHAYTNELMDQIRMKQTLKKIVIHSYESTTDFQKNPVTAWNARLEKIGDEKEKIFFPDEAN